MLLLENLIHIEAIKILILSMLPVTELRFSIPYGIKFYNLSVQYIVLLSIAGNVLIGIVVIYIIGPLMNILKKIYFFNSIIEYIFKKTKIKGDLIDKRKFYGLIIFVSIPLPLTGVWTGALAAYLFNLSKKRSIIAIIVGVLISSAIVTSLSVFTINIF